MKPNKRVLLTSRDVPEGDLSFITRCVCLINLLSGEKRPNKVITQLKVASLRDSKGHLSAERHAGIYDVLPPLGTYRK